jgi:hypothetical protein
MHVAQASELIRQTPPSRDRFKVFPVFEGHEALEMRSRGEPPQDYHLKAPLLQRVAETSSGTLKKGAAELRSGSRSLSGKPADSAPRPEMRTQKSTRRTWMPYQTGSATW